jgi:hypothetical protein
MKNGVIGEDVARSRVRHRGGVVAPARGSAPLRTASSQVEGLSEISRSPLAMGCVLNHELPPASRCTALWR